MKRIGQNILIGAISLLMIIVFLMAFACSDGGNSGDDDDDDSQVDDDQADDDDNEDDDDTSGDDDDDAAEPSWVYVPADTFLMGCVPDDLQCAFDESPQHEVSIDAFEMTTTEITQGQYEAVIGENASLSGYYEEEEIGDDFPVFNVTWAQAKAFCEAVDGRLPTEAEWEFAARGGYENRIYICGDDYECLDKVAWYWDNAFGRVQKAKQKKPNVLGLYDMSGNVREWVADYYLADYYSISPNTNPPGPGAGSERVMRGGNHVSNFDNLRVSVRLSGSVNLQAEGFRCAR
jgi:formylglycine-generating enzyme required for sulfatase activity